jgi:hypothetical protein
MSQDPGPLIRGTDIRDFRCVRDDTVDGYHDTVVTPVARMQRTVSAGHDICRDASLGTGRGGRL